VKIGECCYFCFGKCFAILFKIIKRTLWTSAFIIYRFALFTFTVYRIVILTYRIKWSTRILAITACIFSITRRITVSLVIQGIHFYDSPTVQKTLDWLVKYFAGDKSLSNECPQTLKFKCQSSLCQSLKLSSYASRVSTIFERGFMILFCVLEI
jgi:hypothetical protein